VQLQSIKIVNFRSIKLVTLDTSIQRCLILVGKNEAGKSNILRALSLLNSDEAIFPEDKREPLHDEASISTCYIDYNFIVDEDELDLIYKNIREKFLCFQNTLIMTCGENTYNLLEFCKTRNKGIIKKNIFNNTQVSHYFLLEKKFKLANGWKKISKIALGVAIEINGEEYILKKDTVVNINDYPDLPSDYFEPITLAEINTIVSQAVLATIKEKIPNVIYWKYDEKNILPSRINIGEFSQDPDSCLPLKAMFQLAKITDIGKEIDEANARVDHSLRNLLQRVAQNTTDYFQSVWKEYKSISFELIPNGSYIDAGIRESFNTYGFSQRSDGFKRFVSFLLLIAVGVKTEALKNCIILMDEPDLGLHPSGKRYLRDELIKISRENLIVYSTHSIFMIDDKNIDRHYIVEKENEITNVKSVTNSNYTDEEVLFQALGYSVFQTLKQNNIIFEGWKDKRLFEIALSKISESYKGLRELKKWGLCHVQGVKQIINVVPLLDCADRKYIIVSDGDAPAKEKQKNYNECHYNYPWKRYDELLGSGYKVETSEDFIKNRAIANAIAEIKNKYTDLPLFDADLLLQPKSKIKVLEEWLGSNQDRKKIINDVKDILFDNLKQSDIEESYYKMLNSLKQIALQISDHEVNYKDKGTG
jgi:predicted ATP-dependent endonuclease of OLD family